MKVKQLSADETTIQAWLDENPGVTLISVTADGGTVWVFYK